MLFFALLVAFPALGNSENLAPVQTSALGTGIFRNGRIQGNSTVELLPLLEASKEMKMQIALPKDETDMQKADEFMTEYQTALSDVAKIAAFFGPEGVALAAGLNMAAGIVGLVQLLLGIPKPDPLGDLIKEMWRALDARFDEITIQIQNLKQQVLKSEIAVLFAEPEEVMILFCDEVKKLQAGQTSNETFISSVAPLVTSGKFAVGFGVIRDCISGRNQACNIGGNSFVSQVGEALQWRPTLVSNFFAYYHCLLIQSASAYAAYQVATGAAIDKNYATSIDSMGKAMTDYFTILKGNNFYLQMGTNKIPHVLDNIVGQHENGGKDGAAAITSLFKTEMAAYYDQVKWYRYWMLAVVESHTEYSVVGQPAGTNGNFGYVQNYKGYDIIYAFPAPDWVPTLPSDFSVCEKFADNSAKNTLTCMQNFMPHLWFLMCYNGHSNYFYSIAAGAGYPGPLCQNKANCGAPPGIIWDAPGHQWFIIMG